jgi:hypothetical protein
VVELELGIGGIGGDERRHGRAALEANGDGSTAASQSGSRFGTFGFR